MGFNSDPLCTEHSPKERGTKTSMDCDTVDAAFQCSVRTTFVRARILLRENQVSQLSQAFVCICGKGLLDEKHDSSALGLIPSASRLRQRQRHGMVGVGGVLMPCRAVVV